MDSIKIFDTLVNIHSGDIIMKCCLCAKEFNVDKEFELLWEHYHDAHVQFLMKVMKE